ncbi:hypothetical protein CASFOL_040329 [Castilleja foliolosa]|uniref:Late embryogenesis abundant protein LEA-2 subgroup domain-containing protein n=1 Tax=Castilleja foliolosa TaxID=1961234 RepID=A0ABD3BF56_9LAMI
MAKTPSLHSPDLATKPGPAPNPATILALNVILVVWAVLQPKKPRFTLQDATIFALKVSAPNVISTNLQVTVYSRNPNSRIGIYYDKLSVYANYHNQQVTASAGIPPVYQGHKDVNVWSLFIYGNVPVAPYNGLDLSQYKSNGVVMMTIKINARVKWRFGSFVFGRYHLHVTCPVDILIGNRDEMEMKVDLAATWLPCGFFFFNFKIQMPRHYPVTITYYSRSMDVF